MLSRRATTSTANEPLPARAPDRAAASPATPSLLGLQRTAGNAAVTALLAGRADLRTLQRQPVPADDILASKGPQAKARDDINNALLIGSNWLANAIRHRDNGAALPPHIYRAFNRFFAGTELDRLELLKTRIDDALTWTAGIEFDVIPNPVPPGYRDAQIHAVGIAMAGLHAAALQPPHSSGDVYIAIYPPWFGADAKKRAAVIMHEMFHFFPNVDHNLVGPAEAAWENARAYQGFVMTAAGLPELPGITAMFPP